MSKDISPERQALLDNAFASDPDNEVKVVEYRGKRYEVRAPSLAQIRKAERLSKGDGVDLTARLIVESTYVPSTDEKLFGEAHIASLVEKPHTKRSLVKALSEALESMVKADAEEEGKNSESAPTND